VAHALEHEQPRARHRARQRLAVRRREERVLGAVDDERGRADFAQPLPPRRPRVERFARRLDRSWSATRAASARAAASSKAAAYGRSASTM
jgi:hypothetical protein